MTKPTLPIVQDCEGCGVCCLHMGYPTFIRPIAARTAAEIDADSALRGRATNDRRRRELEAGRPGEPYWERVPVALKKELDEYIENYPENPGTLDGPCLWYDCQTRRCKHHEYRPRVCRDYKVGGKGCREWRETYRLALLDNGALEPSSR